MVFSALNSLQVLSAVLAVFLLVLVGALIFTFKTKPQSPTAADDTSEIAKRVAEANAWGNEIRATNKRKKRGRRNKNSNNPEGTLEDAKQRVSILQGQIELLRHTAEQTRLHASKITTQIADAEQHNDQERLETLLAQRSALYAEADRQLEAVNVAEQEVGQLTLKWELNTTTQPDLIEGSPWLTSPTTQPAESTNLSQALETDRTETNPPENTNNFGLVTQPSPQEKTPSVLDSTINTETVLDTFTADNTTDNPNANQPGSLWPEELAGELTETVTPPPPTTNSTHPNSTDLSGMATDETSPVWGQNFTSETDSTTFEPSGFLEETQHLDTAPQVDPWALPAPPVLEPDSEAPQEPAPETSNASETDTTFLLDFPETSFEPAETFEPSEINTELDSATAETDGVASPAGTSEVLHPRPLNRRSEATVRRRLKHLGMSSALSESDVQMLNTASASITNVEVVDHLQYGLPEEIPERSTVSFTPVDATQT